MTASGARKKLQSGPINVYINPRQSVLYRPKMLAMWSWGFQVSCSFWCSIFSNKFCKKKETEASTGPGPAKHCLPFPTSQRNLIPVTFFPVRMWYRNSLASLPLLSVHILLLFHAAQPRWTSFRTTTKLFACFSLLQTGRLERRNGISVWKFCIKWLAISQWSWPEHALLFRLTRTTTRGGWCWNLVILRSQQLPLFKSGEYRSVEERSNKSNQDHREPLMMWERKKPVSSTCFSWKLLQSKPSFWVVLGVVVRIHLRPVMTSIPLSNSPSWPLRALLFVSTMKQ